MTISFCLCRCRLCKPEQSDGVNIRGANHARWYNGERNAALHDAFNVAMGHDAKIVLSTRVVLEFLQHHFGGKTIPMYEGNQRAKVLTEESHEIWTKPTHCRPTHLH